jgi:hypothetical protein
MITPLENEHFAREWIANGRILSYRFKHLTREAADTWFDDLQAWQPLWTDNRPLLLLYDLRASNTMLSAQALTRARQSADLLLDHPGRTAILMGSNLIAQLISGVIRSSPQGHRERSLFSSEDSALEWLLQNDTTTTQEIVQMQNERE